jgi:hypothetical protein
MNEQLGLKSYLVDTLHRQNACILEAGSERLRLFSARQISRHNCEPCLHERTIWAEKLSGGYASPTKCLHFGGWL